MKRWRIKNQEKGGIENNGEYIFGKKEVQKLIERIKNQEKGAIENNGANIFLILIRLKVRI